MTTTKTTAIPASDVQADHETRNRNAQRKAPSAVDTCFACGRPLTQNAVDEGWAIHLTVDHELAPVDHDVPAADDMGWFSIGSECAKRLPSTHRERSR